MPNIYGQKHDKILEDYLNSNENVLTKEKYSFCKNKSNYIFPAYLYVKVKFWVKFLKKY